MNGAPRAWLREGSIGSGSSGKSGQRFTHIVVLQGPESRELIGLGRAFPRPRNRMVLCKRQGPEQPKYDYFGP